MIEPLESRIAPSARGQPDLAPTAKTDLAIKGLRIGGRIDLFDFHAFEVA